MSIEGRDFLVGLAIVPILLVFFCAGWSSWLACRIAYLRIASDILMASAERRKQAAFKRLLAEERRTREEERPKQILDRTRQLSDLVEQGNALQRAIESQIQELTVNTAHRALADACSDYCFALRQSEEVMEQYQEEVFVMPDGTTGYGTFERSIPNIERERSLAAAMRCIEQVVGASPRQTTALNP